MSTDAPAHRAGIDARAVRRTLVRVLDRGAGPALIGLAVLVVAALVHGLGSAGFQAADDLAQMAAAGCAAAASYSTGLCSTGRLRWSWISTGTGCLMWALGEAMWCYYELLAGRETPFPSLADAGFLLFPVGVVIGLWLFPTAASGRFPWVLDALIAATALLTVSWATVLHTVASSASGSSLLALFVSLAYPVGDVVVIAMVVLTVVKRSAYTRTLSLLGLGLAAMAVADSGFVYLTSNDSYSTGDPIDAGWIAAFLLVMVAAATAPRGQGNHATVVERRPRGLSFLPYVPILLATVTVCLHTARGTSPDTVELLLLAVSVALLLLRQYSTVHENRRLVQAVAAREKQLEQQAYHDQLTGLANRHLFANRVTEALERHAEDGRSFAVLFCDLDDFKGVNDSLGHIVGDQLLVHVADRLRRQLRPMDTLARLGGDEFAVLVEDLDDPATVAHRLVETLQEPFFLDDNRLDARISVGVTIVEPGTTPPTLSSLLSQADVAMYAAKRAGKGTVEHFHAGMTLPETEQLLLAEPLRSALANGDVRAVFQPVMDLGSDTVSSFEALARWTYDGRPVPPPQMVAVAARSGQIRDFTARILDQSLQQLSRWNREVGHDRLQVAINIPPCHVIDLEFPALLMDAAAAHGISAHQLIVEITEDGLLSGLDAARRVTNELRDAGVSLALDDFGTGYSSLAHLHEIPLTTLKIDWAFVIGLNEDPRVERFMRAVLRLGEDLQLGVVVEGVETHDQAETLRRLGCRLAQGYYFAR
ncbi:MAG: putative bifunctional diguanylate cyclase/phosphodiesterase, partial [Actinomycetales bacterium]